MRRREPTDFQAEIESHIALEAERLRAEGLCPADAEAAARRAFGNQTLAEESYYRSSPWLWWDELRHDLIYAARTLRKSPVFAATAILTIALGIGANTAIFSVVNAVLLRPLPFADPDRLVRVAERNDRLNLPLFSASVLNYLAWKEQTHALEALAAFGNTTFNLSGRGDPEQFNGSPISPSLFPLLGIHPVLGRAFREGEDRPGSAAVVMIGESLWKRRFGADAGLIGKSLTLNGSDFTVVGIAPAALALLTGGDILTPLIINAAGEIRLNHVITVAGRLRGGVTLQQAQSEMDRFAARVSQEYPAEMRDWGIRLQSFFHLFVSDDLRKALVVLLAAVSLVLLIACANVANLLLARAASRRKEIALRTALGASRARVLRQLLTESLLLSLAGGAAGLLAAAWTIRLAGTGLSANLLPVREIHLDSTVLLFALGVTLATGLLFGIAPAWHVAQIDLNTVLKQGGRSSTGGTRPLARNGLAAGEIALATILLIGAGLLTRSLLRLEQVRLGFRAENLLTFQLTLPRAKYPIDTKAPVFYRDLLESLRTLPGVRGAAISSGIPFGAGNYTRTPVTTPGKSVLPPGTPIPIDWRIVSPDFFRVLEIPLLSGRVFTERDGGGAPGVMIVSQAMARKFWGTDEALGKVIQRVGDRKELTVIGVVGDVRNNGLNQELPTMYYPSPMRVWPLMDVVLRTEGKPESVLAAARRKVHELDRELPVSTVRTMDQWVSDNAAQPRLNAVLLGIFAGVALLIAAIGIYGVLACAVNQRTREIGLRMALGARRGTVLGLIAREGMLVALAGVMAGLGGGWAMSRALESLLFGVEARDPATFLATPAVLAIVALAACAIPAWRAARVDPMTALRDE